MEGFDRKLFLSLCKKYNVPLSSEYKVPMIQEEDGTIRALTPEYLKQVLLQEDLRMESNNKKINALREGIGRLAASLNEEWVLIRNLTGDAQSIVRSQYYSKLKAVELLGGDWKRDENGKHKIFIAGVTAPAEEFEADDEN